MKIKAIQTTVDGINFRSKLEAHWYLVFKTMGMSPIYEPDAFALSGFFDSCNYLPDFQISCRESGESFMVEIKPKLDGEHEDIAKACLLGYEHQAIVVIGSPYQYQSFFINERAKGNPHGFSCFFNFGKVQKLERIQLFSSYPDEHDWLHLERDDIKQIDFLPAFQLQPLASQCWNQLQFKWGER